ncbi:DUF397 domain-containing protein [Streptomyces sp. NPDC052051]|uniref:DUF397 domain-containing protein n=1 Tax=Streptomyces sp. NPDC052051 TaxID=3154649 RepID=UPI003442F1B6
MPAGPRPASKPLWFKSSYSGGNTTECVECAYVPHGALIRDSKLKRGPVVVVGGKAWRCFVAAVDQGALPVRQVGPSAVL